ncbi:MAG: hypothetical protein JWN13_774 [Betaproteobacteria bacterium]|nr:hypothetical protein [Betaproteobacteria bacterium]
MRPLSRSTCVRRAMAKPQLQLHVVKVRLARPDKAGHDPAAVGTRVWLDVPTGAVRDFQFQEFIVNSSGSLDTVGSSKVASIDRSVTYWSLWTAPGKTLSLPAKFDPDNLDVVPGFGRPLLALLNKTDELILPNSRKVILREFNLSGLDATNPKVSTIKLNRDKATAFYTELHIELDFQLQPKPKGQSDLFVFEGSNGRHLHDIKFLKNPTKAPVVELPLTQTPFTPPAAELAKTVVVIWVRDFINTGVEGQAYHPHRLLPGVQVVTSLIPTNPPNFSVVILSAKGTFASGSAAAAQGPEVFAHELGHVLWADAGGGREMYDDKNNNLTAKNKTTYQDRINSLFIDHMGLDIPPQNVKSFLEARDHHHLSNNVMNAFPANTSAAPTALTFEQVGLFRLAPELRWPGE